MNHDTSETPQLSEQEIATQADNNLLSISVPTFELPRSKFRDLESLQAQEDYAKDNSELAEKSAVINQQIAEASVEKMPELRQQQAEIFYTSTLYKKLTDRYAVTVTPKTIGGVYTEVFTPEEGCATKNQNRVLINFHGGSFTSGSRTASHQESIPIAAVGKIKVVSVDYRMGPEHCFPAASDDALAVYRELLKHYKPESIGIYGCSSGAMLASQLIARLLKEQLALPAAISMSCWSAHDIDGDSNHTVTAQMGIPPFELSNMSYFEGVDKTDPLVIPGASDAVLRQFPPALLMTATRDFIMSTVIQTHSQLVRLGVEADLHIWDGLDHAFVLNPDFTESRESYALMVDFFDQHLQQ